MAKKRAGVRRRYRSYRRRAMGMRGKPITLATYANGAHTAYALFFDTSTGKQNVEHLLNAIQNKGQGTGAELGLVAEGMKALAVENGGKVLMGWLAQLAARYATSKLHISTVVGSYKKRPIRLV